MNIEQLAADAERRIHERIATLACEAMIEIAARVKAAREFFNRSAGQRQRYMRERQHGKRQ